MNYPQAAEYWWKTQLVFHLVYSIYFPSNFRVYFTINHPLFHSWNANWQCSSFMEHFPYKARHGNIFTTLLNQFYLWHCSSRHSQGQSPQCSTERGKILKLISSSPSMKFKRVFFLHLLTLLSPSVRLTKSNFLNIEDTESKHHRKKNYPLNCFPSSVVMMFRLYYEFLKHRDKWNETLCKLWHTR